MSLTGCVGLRFLGLVATLFALPLRLWFLWCFWRPSVGVADGAGVQDTATEGGTQWHGALKRLHDDCIGDSLATECHSFHIIWLRACCRGPVSAASWSFVGRSGRVVCGRGSALCCPCCGLDLVGGNGNICGECLTRAWV